MAKTILTPLQRAFLTKFSESLTLSTKFYLTGGTALSEFYLRHRLSYDLDFFSEEEFPLLPIQAFMKKTSLALNFSRVEYRNFMGLHMFFLHKEKDILKVDFNFYPFPRIEEGKKIEKLFVDSLLDIAVNKLQTIGTQPRVRDFIDLYCIVKETGWSVSMLRKNARIKFDHFIDPLHLGSRFLMAEDAKDLPRMIWPVKKKEWVSFFVGQAKELREEIGK